MNQSSLQILLEEDSAHLLDICGTLGRSTAMDEHRHVVDVSVNAMTASGAARLDSRKHKRLTK